MRRTSRDFNHFDDQWDLSQFKKQLNSLMKNSIKQNNNQVQ